MLNGTHYQTTSIFLHYKVKCKLLSCNVAINNIIWNIKIKIIIFYSIYLLLKFNMPKKESTKLWRGDILLEVALTQYEVKNPKRNETASLNAQSTGFWESTDFF